MNIATVVVLERANSQHVLALELLPCYSGILRIVELFFFVIHCSDFAAIADPVYVRHRHYRLSLTLKVTISQAHSLSYLA
jgi:hypothetical protein